MDLAAHQVLDDALDAAISVDGAARVATTMAAAATAATTTVGGSAPAADPHFEGWLLAVVCWVGVEVSVWKLMTTLKLLCAFRIVGVAGREEGSEWVLGFSFCRLRCLDCEVRMNVVVSMVNVVLPSVRGVVTSVGRVVGQ